LLMGIANAGWSGNRIYLLWDGWDYQQSQWLHVTNRERERERARERCHQNMLWLSALYHICRKVFMFVHHNHVIVNCVK
jgi:hypothetical protein